MDPIIYFLADHYPWWGIPLAFILAEIANAYRRRGYRLKMFLYLSASVSLMALAGAYFFFNGREMLRPAMQSIEKNYLNR